MAKIRNGFVSNSSSTSFVITNLTKERKTLLDFVLENPDLVTKFNEEYSWNNYTQDQMIAAAERRPEEVFYPGENVTRYGDEDGDVLGRVFDYILRDGGKSKSFRWRYKKSIR